MSDQPAAESSVSSPAAPPSSTADIAASVISDAEAADPSSASGASETYETPRTDTTSAVEAPPAAPTEQELSAAAKFLLKQGHKLRKEDGRDVWLPAKTVERMLDRYAGEHQTTWHTERQSIEAQAKEAQEHIAQLRASVAGDPKAFLEELAGIDPRYRAFLEPPARPETPPAADDPMPPPDYDLGNGSRTYSLEGLQKRDAWVQRQLKRELAAELDQKLKPWQEREQQAQQREQQATVHREAHARATAQMQEAQTWPLFGRLADDGSLTEFQQAVLTELQTDSAAAQAAGHPPKLTFEGAYIRVASKRFTEDDTTKRERLLKEIAGAPKGTALSRQTADSPRAAGPRSTTDIARSVIGKLERDA